MSFLYVNVTIVIFCFVIQESVEFFKTFLDNHLVDNPYKISFYKDDFTCSVLYFTGTFKGQMKGLDVKIIQPMNKKFHIEFCTVVHWKDEKIVGEIVL